MNDLKNFEHGMEGTHYACPEKINKSSGRTIWCCGCNNHECNQFVAPPKEPTPLKQTEDILDDYLKAKDEKRYIDGANSAYKEMAQEVEELLRRIRERII